MLASGGNRDMQTWFLKSDTRRLKETKIGVEMITAGNGKGSEGVRGLKVLATNLALGDSFSVCGIFVTGGETL